MSIRRTLVRTLKIQEASMPKGRITQWGQPIPDTPTNFDYKTEHKTDDGYEIQSGNHYGDPAKGRFFTVWPPEGNAVGTYGSVEDAHEAIKQWRQHGDPKLLQRDGGANFKIK